MRLPPRSLSIALVVYVGLRALLLATAFDEFSLPNFELFPMGTLAEVATLPWRGPPLSAYYDNCGGHLIVGLCAAPLYAVFGASYLTLKAVPLLLGIVDLLLIWDLCARLFGRRAAFVASLAFALGPATLVTYSVLAKGNHFEGITFQLAAVWLLYRGHESERPGRWWWLAAAMGGFAIFAYLGAMLWIALLALTHVAMRGTARGLRDLARGLPPFLLGLAPLLWIQLVTGRPATVLANFVGGSRAWERARELVVDLLPQAAGYPDLVFLSGSLANRLSLLLFAGVWVLAAAACIGWLRAARRGPQDARDADRARFRGLALLPFCLYLPAFVVTFALTTPRFQAYLPPIEVQRFRYLVPHFTFACVLVGAASVWGRRSAEEWQRSLGRGMAHGTLALGACLLPLVDWTFAHVGDGLRYPGSDLATAAHALLRHPTHDQGSGRLVWDFDRVQRELASYTPCAARRAVFGSGYTLAWAQAVEHAQPGTDRQPLLDVQRLLAWAPEALRGDLARGAGCYLARELRNGGSRQRLGAWLESIAFDPTAHAEEVVEGLSQHIPYWLARRTPEALAHNEQLGELVPHALRQAWRRGQGRFCGTLLARGIAREIELVQAFGSRLPDQERSAYWQGVGTSWGLRTCGKLPNSATDGGILGGISSADRATLQRALEREHEHCLETKVQ